jgi:hypothetical protein
VRTLRSAFTEEFRDANGFGWSVEEHPPFNWKELIAKKVNLHSAAFPRKELQLDNLLHK